MIALKAQVKELKDLQDLKLSAQLICKLKEDNKEQKEQEIDGQNGTTDHGQKTRPNKHSHQQNGRKCLPRKMSQNTSK